MNQPDNISSARVNRAGDLIASQLPDISGEGSKRAAVVLLYRWTEQAAIATLDWYMTEKRSKAKWSRTLRVLAVIFAAAGTVAPLIAVGTGNTKYAFWGYPVLALSAATVALDRAFGFSTSWMRYLATAATLQRSLLDYQLKWAALSSEWTSTKTESDGFHEAIKEIRSFADQLSDLVIDETRSWVEEFRGHFSRLEAEVSHI